MQVRKGKSIIAGARVLLRAPVSSDKEAWVRLRRSNRSYLETSEPTPVRGVNPFAISGFERMLAAAATERSVRLLVCLRKSNQIVGQISLTDISRGRFRSCYVGYWLGQQFAGDGLMTEALSLALHYAFTQLRLHRVEANIMPSNIASRGVAARCGFRYEGLGRRLLHLFGQWRDLERWAITAEDRREATGPAKGNRRRLRQTSKC
jgi:ribosomal-protein-alanine N-acetyltransferase